MIKKEEYDFDTRNGAVFKIEWTTYTEIRHS